MNNFYFSRKVTLSRYKYYFCVKFFDGGKWKKTFSSLIFWKHGTVNEWDYRHFLSNEGDRVFRHPLSGKAEVVTHGNLYANMDATCELKSRVLFQFPYCELCDNDNKQSN